MLCGLFYTALAQTPLDTFIFRYSLDPATNFDRFPEVEMTFKYSNAPTETKYWPGLYAPVSEEMITTKEIEQIDIRVTYIGSSGCKHNFYGTTYMSGPYDYEVREFQLLEESGDLNCMGTPGENYVNIEMSLLPVIHIVNPDRAADPTNNVYCDNAPVHLKVDYFADQLNAAYWQYRVDNGDYYPLDYNTYEGNWSSWGIQGNDISFTLRDIFGANYTQYLNKRIEFRAVEAQVFGVGSDEGNGIPRRLDRPTDGSNSFTYIFYPSTVLPVKVTSTDPLCSDGKTFGVDIQFDRPLMPGEVINPITIKTQVGDQTVDQYPRSESDPPITLDASNTFHFSGVLNPGDYYLNMEGYYLGTRQCNQNNYNFSIHAPPPVSFTVDDKKDVTCFGEANGAITLKGNGGTGAYAYSIDNGVNWQSPSNTFTGLAKGSYTIIARDANNCPAAASQTVTIDQPAAAMTAQVTGYADPTSATKNDGKISIEVNGGTTPYAYLWNNGATTEDISGLGGGTYTVTVTDAHNCTVAIDPLALVAPLPITINFTETPVSCYGLSDGVLQAAVSGGVKPYTYSWSNGNSTARAIKLAAGHYSLLVTDANDVQFTQGYDLTAPAALEVIPTVTPVSCNSKTDGSITTVVNGGTIPYTYRWNNGATTPDLTQVPAGNYRLSVTDAHNCPIALDTSITEPAALVINGTVTPPSRFGSSDAKIDATIGGGTIPYIYAWSSGAATEDLNALAAGDYTLTVTDNNNCATSKTFNVNQPAQLILTITRDAVVDCYGSSTGTLTVHASGGVSPYSYQWSNGSATASTSQLPAGHYEVQVTDANNVTATQVYDLTEPVPLKIVPTVTGVSCNSRTDGAITTAVNGGTAPYTYRWNNGAVTPGLSQLAAGSYQLSVTDARNCPVSLDIPVPQPAELSISGIVTQPSRSGNTDAKIDVTVSGGTIPYTYAWSNGATTADIDALPEGAIRLVSQIITIVRLQLHILSICQGH